MRFTPAASLALALALPLATGCGRRVDGPNILLITLDTTRRDHLGMYGYRIPTSPNLDRLAQDSVLYTNAYAVSSWTMPTHASLFTGKFPSAHGANYDPAGPLILGEEIGEQFGGYRARPIAENETTLAQILTEHGYATGGIIAGPWMKKRFRLAKGFEHYDDEGVTGLNGRPGEDVTRAAIEFVDEHADDGFFLFLNYYDAHSPWFTDPVVEDGKVTKQANPFQDIEPVRPPGMTAPRSYPEFANVCYDAEIRYMDAQIGKLIDHLRLRGLYEDTWIFVLADHGELIGDPVLSENGPEGWKDEHGMWGHGDSLSQAEIHIPFFVKEPGPDARKGEDAHFVQQTDVLPTILQRLGIALPPNVQGRPLGEEHLVVSELYKLPLMNVGSPRNPKDWRNTGDWRVLVDGRYKFGWSSNGTHFLVDLQQDPLERANVRDEHAELVERLDKALATYIRLLPEPGETGAVEQPTQEEIQLLHDLGYGGEDAPGTPPQPAPPEQAEPEKP